MAAAASVLGKAGAKARARNRLAAGVDEDDMFADLDKSCQICKQGTHSDRINAGNREYPCWRHPSCHSAAKRLDAAASTDESKKELRKLKTKGDVQLEGLGVQAQSRVR